jgi:4-hydroxy-2-oxoheptanedioate aldolase
MSDKQLNDSLSSMRSSRVLRKLRDGGVVFCAKLNLADARVSEIAARSGFDCIWVDQEHVPNTLHDIENSVRAAKAYDVDTVVRVPRGSYSDLVYPLEMDAAGIMVPHCMGAEDAKQIARSTRFAPIGLRPLDGGNSDGGFCMMPILEYMRQANKERFVIAQIEDPEGVDELEEIAQVDGIDLLLFGAGDYGQSIGTLAEPNHPKVQEVRRRIPEVARKHGKFAGLLANTENFTEAVEMGYQFISICADVVILGDAFRSILARVNTLSEKGKP